MQKTNGTTSRSHSLRFSNCKVFDLNFRLIDGPRCLEHFDSLSNVSRDLHGRGFARECGSREVRLSKIASGALKPWSYISYTRPPCVRHWSLRSAFIEASKCIHLDVSLSQCSAVLFRLPLLRLGFWKNFRSTPTSCKFQTFQSF